MAAFGPGDAQHSRTHHWSQREGDQQTDQHRCSRSDSELIEEASGNARHKGHGYENNDEAESRGQYRMPDVRCRDTGGLKGFQFLLFMNRNVFSRTTRASSITMPTMRTSASMV